MFAVKYFSLQKVVCIKTGSKSRVNNSSSTCVSIPIVNIIAKNKNENVVPPPPIVEKVSGYTTKTSSSPKQRKLIMVHNKQQLEIEHLILRVDPILDVVVLLKTPTQRIQYTRPVC